MKIYGLFEEEFKKSEATKASLNFFEDGVMQYKVTSQVDPEDFGIVDFKNDEDGGDIVVTCSCKHFEEVGWLCFHCFRVLKQNDVLQLPQRYFLPRWTRDLKKDIWDREKMKKAALENGPECIAWRHHMNRVYVDLIMKSESNMDARRLLEDSYQRDLIAINQLVGKQDETTSSGMPNVSTTTVLNPPHIKTKGRSKKRIKSHIEKKGKSAKATNKSGTVIPRKEHLI